MKSNKLRAVKKNTKFVSCDEGIICVTLAKTQANSNDDSVEAGVAFITNEDIDDFDADLGEKISEGRALCKRGAYGAYRLFGVSVDRPNMRNVIKNLREAEAELGYTQKYSAFSSALKKMKVWDKESISL